RFTDKQAYIDEGKAALTEILTAWTRRHTREEIFQAAQEIRVAMAPAYDIAGHLASPILASRAWVLTQDHPRAGRLLTPGFPYKLSETPAQVRRPAPDLTPRPPSLGGKGESWTGPVVEPGLGGGPCDLTPRPPSLGGKGVPSWESPSSIRAS